MKKIKFIFSTRRYQKMQLSKGSLNFLKIHIFIIFRVHKSIPSQQIWWYTPSDLKTPQELCVPNSIKIRLSDNICIAKRNGGWINKSAKLLHCNSRNLGSNSKESAVENQTRDLVTYPARCESAHCGGGPQKRTCAAGGCVFAKSDRREEGRRERIFLGMVENPHWICVICGVR